MFPPGHKLHDPEFLIATGGVLPCHPMYHQVRNGWIAFASFKEFDVLFGRVLQSPMMLSDKLLDK